MCGLCGIAFADDESGLACKVATRVGGIPDLVANEEAGLLVPEGDVDAMAEAALRLLAGAGLASRLSRAGWAVVQAAVEECVIAHWETMLADTASSRPKSESRG